MNNYYKPPESDLSVDDLKNKRPHVIWRVFFWVNIAMLPLLLLILVLPALSLFDYIDMVAFCFFIVGIYSYSYNKVLLSKLIWKISFIFCPLWFVLYEIAGPLLIEMTHYGEPAVIDGYTIFSLIFVVPTTYALYSISFKSKQ